MVDNFPVHDGGISVRKPQGGYKPVKTPLGFTDLQFRNAVAATYTLYRQNGVIPSVAEVFRYHPAIPTPTYSALFLTPEFRQALEYRGVVWEEKSGISLEQNSVLIKMADFSDRRSLGVKLRELGVPMARYQAWLKHPLFRKAVNDLAESNLQDAVAPALTALAGKAAAGEDNAIKAVLEMTGRWNPSAQSLEDARTVVMALVEAITKHVKDPDTRKAIMADTALTAGTLIALEQ